MVAWWLPSVSLSLFRSLRLSIYLSIYLSVWEENLLLFWCETMNQYFAEYLISIEWNWDRIGTSNGKHYEKYAPSWIITDVSFIRKSEASNDRNWQYLPSHFLEEKKTHWNVNGSYWFWLVSVCHLRKWLINSTLTHSDEFSLISFSATVYLHPLGRHSINSHATRNDHMSYLNPRKFAVFPHIQLARNQS